MSLLGCVGGLMIFAMNDIRVHNNCTNRNQKFRTELTQPPSKYCTNLFFMQDSKNVTNRIQMKRPIRHFKRLVCYLVLVLYSTTTHIQSKRYIYRYIGYALQHIEDLGQASKLMQIFFCCCLILWESCGAKVNILYVGLLCKIFCNCLQLDVAVDLTAAFSKRGRAKGGSSSIYIHTTLLSVEANPTAFIYYMRALGQAARS